MGEKFIVEQRLDTGAAITPHGVQPGANEFTTLWRAADFMSGLPRGETYRIVKVVGERASLYKLSPTGRS